METKKDPYKIHYLILYHQQRNINGISKYDNLF